MTEIADKRIQALKEALLKFLKNTAGPAARLEQGASDMGLPDGPLQCNCNGALGASITVAWHDKPIPLSLMLAIKHGDIPLEALHKRGWVPMRHD